MFSLLSYFILPFYPIPTSLRPPIFCWFYVNLRNGFFGRKNSENRNSRKNRSHATCLRKMILQVIHYIIVFFWTSNPKSGIRRSFSYFWEKPPSVVFNYYKRMALKQSPSFFTKINISPWFHLIRSSCSKGREITVKIKNLFNWLKVQSSKFLQFIKTALDQL